MGAEKTTFPAAWDRLSPRDRDRAIVAAALGLKGHLNRLEHRVGRTLERTEHYIGRAWEHYIHGSGKDKLLEIDGFKGIVGLLVRYAAFFVSRDAFPKIKNKDRKNEKDKDHEKQKDHLVRETNMAPEFLDGYPSLEQSPESHLLSEERHKLESAVIKLLFTERDPASIADEDLLPDFIKLVSRDTDAQKEVGSCGLNAQYVANRLGISPERASTLWARFKKLCRAVDTPELRMLIDNMDVQWLRKLPAVAEVTQAPEPNGTRASDPALRHEGSRS
jgi:hypothetical protein